MAQDVPAIARLPLESLKHGNTLRTLKFSMARFDKAIHEWGHEYADFRGGLVFWGWMGGNGNTEALKKAEYTEISGECCCVINGVS